jgi:hypothetical protein
MSQRSARRVRRHPSVRNLNEALLSRIHDPRRSHHNARSLLLTDHRRKSSRKKSQNKTKGPSSMDEKLKITLDGTVEKIIKSQIPSVADKAQIAVDGADHLYKELRIENTLTDGKGNEAHLTAGTKVEITVEADPPGVSNKP